MAHHTARKATCLSLPLLNIKLTTSSREFFTLCRCFYIWSWTNYEVLMAEEMQDSSNSK